MGQGNVRFLELLGKGSYGEVYKAKFNGKLVAAKRLHPLLVRYDPGGSNGIVEKFRQECELLQQLRHPNIVEIIGVVQEENKPPILITELCDCDLDSYIENSKTKPKLLLEEVVTIMGDVGKGLYFLHNQEKPIIHRDICPKNILIIKKDSVLVAKIADVGLAKIMGNVYNSPVPGTQAYMAPETFGAFDSPWVSYGTQMDIFSFGMTILEAIVGHTPCPTENPLAEHGEISIHAQLRKDIHEVGDKNPLRALVLNCLERDPERRPTAEEIVDTLHDHQILTEVVKYDFQFKKQRVCDDFHSWIPVRRRTVRELEELKLDEITTKLDEHHRKASIATAAGASSSVLATGLVIGGFIGSFFTFGATIPLMITGGAVAAAGGLTTFGAKMSEVYVSRTQFKKVEDTIAEDKQESEELRKSLQELDQLILRNVDRIFEEEDTALDLPTEGIENVMIHFQKITGMKIMDSEQLHPVKSSARGVGAVLAVTTSGITAGTAAARVGSAVFDTLTVAARATHIAGFVTSMIALPIDAYFLVTSIKDIKNNTPSEVAEKIRDIRAKMVCPQEIEIPELIQAYVEAKVAESAEGYLKKIGRLQFDMIDDLDEFLEHDELEGLTTLFDE